MTSIKLNPTPQSLLGINIRQDKFFLSQFSFIDLMKKSGDWRPSGLAPSDTWHLDVDDNDYLKSLRDIRTGQTYESISLLINNAPELRKGRYHVFYQGAGDISYSGNVSLNRALSTERHHVVDVKGNNFILRINNTDPQKTGNYIRDIQIIHESDLERYQQGEIFGQEFLDHVDQLGSTIRFMDWVSTNHQTVSSWQDRPRLSERSYSTDKGSPIETVVALSNQLDKDVWINVPHLASNGYVRRLASYLKNNLDPNLKVYVEYSNEVWNTNFAQGRYAQAQAEAQGLHPDEWYGRRSVEVIQLFEEVFGADDQRLIGVIANQAGNTFRGERSLSLSWTNEFANLQEAGVDSIAANIYFGGYIGRDENFRVLQDWATRPDGLDLLFREITQGGLLPFTREGGAFADALRNIDQYAQLAEQNNLDFFAYEGGLNIPPRGRVERSREILNLFEAAERDPRTAQLYEQLYEHWFSVGGDLFNNFVFVGLIDNYAETTPRYETVLESVDRYQTIYEGELGYVEGLNHQIQTIDFSQTYDNAVVIVSPLTYNGTQTANVRIVNIEDDGFRAFVQEPNHYDGNHVSESFNFLVFEAGHEGRRTYLLDQGKTIVEVFTIQVGGTINQGATDPDWERAIFSQQFQAFQGSTAVLSHVQTFKGGDYVQVRHQNQTNEGIDIGLQEEEARNPGSHIEETVGIVAIKTQDPLNGTFNVFNRTTTGLSTEQQVNIAGNAPVFANIATSNDFDPVGLRRDGNRLILQEDTTLDQEIAHAREQINGVILNSVSLTSRGVIDGTQINNRDALLNLGLSDASVI